MDVQHGVCVECGAYVENLIQKLQVDNYCLTPCKNKDCKQITDKYQEYENNLKFISLCLCLTPIYRHIYFNIKEIPGLFLKCFGLTIFWLIAVYWHENLNPDYELPPHHKKIHDQVESNQKEQNEIQYKNLMRLLTFDKTIAEVVFRQYVTFITVLFLLTYLVKTVQAKKYQQVLRLWWVIMLSQLGFFFVVVKVVWNYDQQFFNFLRIHSIYSSFMCLRGVINSKYEDIIAALIIVCSSVAGFSGMIDNQGMFDQVKNMFKV